MSRPDWDPGSHPEMRPIAPARRSTDRYMVVGFAGVALLGYIMAIVVLVIPEPDRPYHLFLAGALFAASTMPAIAAAGIARLLYLQLRRRKKADRGREARPWKREQR